MADENDAVALGELGAGLLDAGYAVTDVQEVLCAVAAVRGRSDITVGVLPSAVLIDDPLTAGTRLTNATGEQLTFDQVAQVASLARSAELNQTALPEVGRRLREVRSGERSPARS